MTKKHEALNKAKQSGRKVVEGGKEFGKGGLEVVGGTAGALGYALLSSGEKIASKVSKVRENEEGLNDEERKRRKDNAEKYNERAKKHIIKAGHYGKKAVLGTWKATKGGVKALGYGAKAGYHLIDAGDKAIGEKIEKRQLEKGKNPGKAKQLARDNIIKLLIALGALGYGGYQGGKSIIENNQGVIVESDNSDSNETLLIPTAEYNLLNGKTISSKAELTCLYLGGNPEKGNLVIGDTLALNSADALHNLRAKKIQDYGQSTTDINELDSIDTSTMTPEEIQNFRIKYPIDAAYLLVAKPYIDGKENKGKMTFEQFMKGTKQIVDNLKKDTEAYDGGLTGSKKELFDAIRSDIDGESIVAYAMTELCENKESGEFNIQFFDLLLRNAGVKFLSYIPAIYDGKTSYGLYQFTEFALYDTPDDVRGASVVNKVLPYDKKIPGSVIDLKTREDQTKAAYMFALCNLNSAVRKLTNEEAASLLEYQKNNKENFVNNMTQLIAMCHHRPADSVALKEWHKAKYKNDIYNYGKAQTYGKASRNNFKALRK